jgi:hypothetical protein
VRGNSIPHPWLFSEASGSGKSIGFSSSILCRWRRLAKRRYREKRGGCEARRSVGSPPVINVSSAWKSTIQRISIHPHMSGEGEKSERANTPCRQIGHELDNSKSQGSTQAWWKTCLPSHGKTRTSSPSSKSTIQIGHVSRPIDSGSGSSCAEEAVVVEDGPARGRAGGRSASSSSGTSSAPPASASASALLPEEVLASASARSVSAVHAVSRWVSRISCPGCCPSPCASTSFASVSVRRAPNLMSGKVSRIARVRTPPRPPPPSPAPAATR